MNVAQPGCVPFLISQSLGTREQNPESKTAELRASGANQIYVDQGESYRDAVQPQWIARKAQLKPRDTLVIRALDREAGEERMAIEIIRELGVRGVRIKSLTEPFLDVDISTPMGEATAGNMAAMAQLCVSMIRENTHRGLAHARPEKAVGGRTSWMKTAPPRRGSCARK
ncbi:recombinase family protein [Glutamicibacter sp. FR1]|uniref:recombinase family protein n=1 Tax=Glutamicibacter sp. FR1 TaxID=3393744 RepID=UPI0039AF1CBE